MKVKDLIEELQNYNPDAYIGLLDDGRNVRMRLTGVSYNIDEETYSRIMKRCEDIEKGIVSDDDDFDWDGKEQCVLVDLVVEDTDKVQSDLLEALIEDGDGETTYLTDEEVYAIDGLDGDFIMYMNHFDAREVN